MMYRKSTQFKDPLSNAHRIIESLYFSRHRHAANAWLNKVQSNKLTNEKLLYVERLLKEWKHFTCRHGKNSSPQFLFAFFSFMLSLNVSQQPAGNTIRYYLRTLRRFPYADTWKMFCNIHEKHQSAVKIFMSWKKYYRQRTKEKQEYNQAQVKFEDIHNHLLGLLDFFLDTQSCLSLSADEMIGRQFSASTNGRVIRLPETVAISSHQLLNRAAYVYLLSHEAEHINSSFHFNFLSETGKKLWAMLSRRRRVFKINKESWDKDKIIDTLLDQGFQVRKDFEPRLTNLSAFFMHFSSPKAVHNLWNLFEDVRIERIIENKYPGIKTIKEIITPCLCKTSRASLFCTVEENFLKGLQSKALGYKDDFHITENFSKVWLKIKKILQAYRKAPVGNTASSLLTTLRVYEAFEKYLPEPSMQALNSLLIEDSQISVETIVYGLEMISEKYIWEDDPSTCAEYLDLEESDPEESGPWFSYPEYDVWESDIENDAVKVREILFKPFKALNDLPNRRFQQQIGVPDISSAKSGKNTLKYEAEGTRLDIDQYHEFKAKTMAGVDSDNRVFKSKNNSQAYASFSVLMDLSVSMEIKRNWNGLNTPLSIAKYLTRAITEKLQLAGVKTGVFGLHDFGKKLIDFQIVKDYEDPFDPVKIESLHALYFGGARIGAGIRHIGGRVENAYPGKKHIVLVLIDNGSRYLAKGMENTLKKIVPQCKDCRHVCRFEPVLPQIRARSYDRINLYYPANYEYGDVCHAISSMPRIRPFFVMLDSEYSPGLLDKTLGHDNWTSCVTFKDTFKIEQKIAALFE